LELKRIVRSQIPHDLRPQTLRSLSHAARLFDELELTEQFTTLQYESYQFAVDNAKDVRFAIMDIFRDGAHKVRAVHGAIRGKLRLRIVSVIGIRYPDWYEARRLEYFQPGLGLVRVVHQWRPFDAAFEKPIPSQLPEVIAILITLEWNLEHSHANTRVPQ